MVLVQHIDYEVKLEHHEHADNSQGDCVQLGWAVRCCSTPSHMSEMRRDGFTWMHVQRWMIIMVKNSVYY
jgi:hypothetical protein